MTRDQQVNAIAEAFAEVMRQWLTPAEFAEMKALNETPAYADAAVPRITTAMPTWRCGLRLRRSWVAISMATVKQTAGSGTMRGIWPASFTWATPNLIP
jgi:hypothetical protein